MLLPRAAPAARPAAVARTAGELMTEWFDLTKPTRTQSRHSCSCREPASPELRTPEPRPRMHAHCGARRS
jgi:hypothetical protein